VSDNDSPQIDAANRSADEQDAANSPAADDPAVEESLASDVLDAGGEDLRAELADAKDRALRSQAELENYRKRVARQSEEDRRYAEMRLIRDLLPVWDNMGRAIEAAEKANEADSLLEGFKMVIRLLEEVLTGHHCIRIEALDEPFDPHLHEAISQQPSENHAPGTVSHVTQTGFLLHDRVVRPSQVVVSSAPPVPDQADDD